MKTCPKCQRTYTDDNLNFCLEDGAVLNQSGGTVLPETVLLNQPRTTLPNQAGGTAGAGQFSMQPKRSSKTWLWVIGILGALALICGGGLVGFVAFISQMDNKAGNSVNTAGNRTTATSTPADDPTVQEVDLSGWVQDFSVYGDTEFADDELMVSSKEKNYYYVLVATAEYQTGNSTTSIAVRNVDSADSRMGYGLVFHSDPSPLTRDYALLIDSVKQRYRIVQHVPSKENVLTAWTNSSSIKKGTQENILEARDKDGKVDLYINGKLINSVTAAVGSTTGVPGVYSGDGVKAAFSKLVIRR